MMHRYRGKDVWNKRSSANTLFSGGEALQKPSASQQRDDLPTHLTWTRTSAETLSVEMSHMHRQHVVYLSSATAVTNWTDALRESMAKFTACAQTEFNIGNDLLEDLLRS